MNDNLINDIDKEKRTIDKRIKLEELHRSPGRGFLGNSRHDGLLYGWNLEEIHLKSGFFHVSSPTVRYASIPSNRNKEHLDDDK